LFFVDFGCLLVWIFVNLGGLSVLFFVKMRCLLVWILYFCHVVSLKTAYSRCI
jgi:hypothetical protein